MGWLHELKHDGFRILAHKDGERVHLWSRNGRDRSRDFVAMADAVRALPASRIVLQIELFWTCSRPRGKRTAVARALHHFTRSRLAWFLLNASGTERPCRYSPFSARFPKWAWFARVEHHLLSLGGRRAWLLRHRPRGKRTAVARALHHFTRSRLAWFLLNASGTERPCRYSPFSARFPKWAWFARVQHHLLSLGGRRACFAIDNARSRLRGGGRGCPRWRRRVVRDERARSSWIEHQPEVRALPRPPSRRADLTAVDVDGKHSAAPPWLLYLFAERFLCASTLPSRVSSRLMRKSKLKFRLAREDDPAGIPPHSGAVALEAARTDRLRLVIVGTVSLNHRSTPKRTLQPSPALKLADYRSRRHPLDSGRHRGRRGLCAGTA